MNISNHGVYQKQRVFRSCALSLAGTLAGLGMMTSGAEAFTIVPTSDQNLLVNTLVDGSVVVGSISSSLAPGAAGIFSNGFLAGIGIDQGIILTTGKAVNALGPNGNAGEFEVSGVGNPTPEINFGASTDNNRPGDSQLSSIVGATTFDATILQFDFIAPTAGTIAFNYVFASEEYIDYENTEFNDIFGFFLNGNNIALLPVAGTPAVSINTVNSVNNSSFFNQNISVPGPAGPSPFNIEYDGFTNVLVTLNASVVAGNNTIRLALADTSDRVLDSAVFLEKGSFRFQEAPPATIPEPISVLGLLTVGAFFLQSRRKLV